MPKKSKVNKLARMSDEERARYLQHRADLEEEARRRKQELIARFIKNKLDKEEAFSRKNTAKLNQIWRFILRRVKCKQMILDIQGMMSAFNYMMDRKQRLVTTLMSAIDDSDDQHRRAFQAHTETINDFLDIGRQRLDKIHDEYENQKNILLENWDKQEMDISDNQDQVEFTLKLITYIQDRDFKNYNKDTEIENATAMNDARLEHDEEMRALRAPKEQEIDMYWTRLREAFMGYVDQHRPIMAHYQQLREKDEFYQRDIERNERMIHNATKIVLTLQKEYANTTTNINAKITRMNCRKEELWQRYWQMKKDSKTERNRSEKQLLILVDASREVIQRMEAAKQKLNKIQQLSLICHKYEKDGDNRTVEETDNNDRAVTYENLDEAMIKECKEYKKLDKFMLKMNHVKVQTMCLQAEKRKLTKENDGLKHYIKKYLTELALKMDKPRPISANLQSEHKSQRPKINRPVTCIEGAVCNAVMHEKRIKIFEKKAKKNQMRSYPRVQNWF